MDILSFVGDYANIGAGGLLSVVVILILTGRLLPRWVLKRAQEEAEAWKKALSRSEDARQDLAQENFKLLETARIAQRFYLDVIPPIDEDTTQRRRHAAERERAT